MKRFICAVLCLSMILTFIAGIASASSTSHVRATSSYEIDGFKVTGYAYDIGARAGYFAHVRIHLKVNYVRGEGLSNAGYKYTKSKDYEAVTKTRGAEIKTASTYILGANARDVVTHVECSAQKWWTTNKNN